jgi:phosphoribosylformylglycinamidine (FGAM) synthase-like enzyme
VLLVGRRRPETAGSVYLDLGFTAGRPAVPPLDFAEARRGIRAVCDLVAAGLVTAAHDIGDGGLAACLAEMAIGLEGAGLLGAEIALPVHAGLTAREYLFGEAGGFVLTVSPGTWPKRKRSSPPPAPSGGKSARSRPSRACAFARWTAPCLPRSASGAWRASGRRRCPRCSGAMPP